MKKTLSALLAVVMIFSFVGVLSSCVKSPSLPETTPTPDVYQELVLIEDTEDGTDEETAPPEQVQQTQPDVQSADEDTADVSEPEENAIDENGSYDDKESVALYILTYGKLPKNYITKKEAENLGWTGGSVEQYAPGKCIGGSYFGNYENKLPKKKGREYHECDIGTLGKSSRGAKRIIYSNDGLIYYTADHYETFELLYGEE